MELIRTVLRSAGIEPEFESLHGAIGLLAQAKGLKRVAEDSGSAVKARRIEVNPPQPVTPDATVADPSMGKAPKRDVRSGQPKQSDGVSTDVAAMPRRSE